MQDVPLGIGPEPLRQPAIGLDPDKRESFLREARRLAPELVIVDSARRDGVDGYWTKAFPVTGGRHYRFDARYQAKGVDLLRHSVVAEIHWRDAEGRHVPLDEPAVSGYLRGATPIAETD